MGSRLVPVVLALSAVLLDLSGLHGLAGIAVLFAIPAAAASAFVGTAAALERRRDYLVAASTVAALALLVAGSAVREGAPSGGHVPTAAVSAVVAALVAYAVPLVTWLLEPLVPKPRAARA